MENDFICGYLNPSVVSSSGSQRSKPAKVSRLDPLTKRRQLAMPAFLTHSLGKLYPSSTFFRRIKLMSLSHQVDACSLLATALSPRRGQKTSWLGFSGVHLSSTLEKIFPAPNTEPGSQFSPPRICHVLPAPWKKKPKSTAL